MANRIPAAALRRGDAARQGKAPGIYNPGDVEPVVADLPLLRPG
jgi:hypothetical protein